MRSFGVAIVTYNGPHRVKHLLESLVPDKAWIDYLVISEDPTAAVMVHEEYRKLAEQYGAVLSTRETWGCMQGNAAHAMRYCPTDIVCLLSDDILCTRGCMKSVRGLFDANEHVPIGVAQIPYHGSWTDMVRLGFIPNQDHFWYDWKSWIGQVPQSSFWNGDGRPRIYVNVHGSGFAITHEAWDAVGGCSQEHWSYDEDIAARVWLETENIVVAFPGQPFVHYGGASQCGNEHPETDYHTLEAWKRGWGGRSKEEVHSLIRERMAERAHWDEQMKSRRIG